MDESQALQQDIDRLRTYGEALTDPAERAEVMAEVEAAQARLDAQKLKTYAASAEPNDEATGEGEPEDPEDPEDEEDGLNDSEMQELIAELKAEGYDAEDDEDAPEEGAPKEGTPADPATPPAKTYAEQQPAKTYAEQRLERLTTEGIDQRVDALVAGDKLIPADAAVVKRACYTLAGVQPQGQLRAYAEAERDDAVDSLLGLLDRRQELGILNRYTQADHAGREDLRHRMPSVTAPSGPQTGGSLDSQIKAYAAKHGIADYGKAMLAYEKEHGSDTVRRYSEGED